MEVTANADRSGQTGPARRTEAPGRHTYVVDHYRPGLDPDELRQLAERVRDAVAVLAGEGKAVRWVDSTVVPEDEYFQSVLEASSKALVREVHARAGVSFERMSIAIRIESRSLARVAKTGPVP